MLGLESCAFILRAFICIFKSFKRQTMSYCLHDSNLSKHSLTPA